MTIHKFNQYSHSSNQLLADAAAQECPMNVTTEPLRVCFIVEGSARRGLSPAARFRVLEYLPHFEKAGITPVVRPSRPSKYFAHGRAMTRIGEWFGDRVRNFVARQAYRYQVFNRYLDFRVAG